MQHAEAIITARMRYTETFDPFVYWGEKIEVRMRKGITAHARVKKGAYHPRNTKIPSSCRIAFFLRKKGITLIYAMWGIDLSLFRVDPRGDPWRTSKQQLVQVYTHKYYYKYFWQVSTSGVTIGLVLIYVRIQ